MFLINIFGKKIIFHLHLSFHSNITTTKYFLFLKLVCHHIIYCTSMYSDELIIIKKILILWRTLYAVLVLQKNLLDPPQY